MRILIDADGCPVMDHAVRIARRNGLECLIVCDTAHRFNKPGARTITVSKGADSADFALLGLLAPGDLVVTQDYGLAAMCLAKQARPLSQDGMVYDQSNIDALLLARHTAGKIRRAGGRLRGPAKRRTAQDEAFCTALQRLIEQGSAPDAG